jgi:hypothetical protein
VKVENIVEWQKKEDKHRTEGLNKVKWRKEDKHRTERPDMMEWQKEDKHRTDQT